MYELSVGNKTYKVTVGKNGNPISLIGYGGRSQTLIEIMFNDEDFSHAEDEIIDILKGVYINRIIGEQDAVAGSDNSGF